VKNVLASRHCYRRELSMIVTLGNHYLAFVLDDDCRKRYLGLYTKSHPVQVCHHVTLAYNFTQEDLPRLQALVDSNPSFELNCLILSDTIDFFRVLVNKRLLETDSSYTHLTYTRKASARNSDSNRVFKGELEHTGMLSAGGVLTGSFQLLPK
jgi:hypothetical protein